MGYRIIANDGDHVTSAEHLYTALHLAGAIHRASEVRTDDCEAVVAVKRDGIVVRVGAEVVVDVLAGAA